jgi:excisionase family DNA binding protein
MTIIYLFCNIPQPISDQAWHCPTRREARGFVGDLRPFVVGLIDKGTLPARTVGAHRRVQLDDVLAYKRASKTKARAALKEMVGISQELGLE